MSSDETRLTTGPFLTSGNRCCLRCPAAICCSLELVAVNPTTNLHPKPLRPSAVCRRPSVRMSRKCEATHLWRRTRPLTYVNRRSSSRLQRKSMTFIIAHFHRIMYLSYFTVKRQREVRSSALDHEADFTLNEFYFRTTCHPALTEGELIEPPLLKQALHECVLNCFHSTRRRFSCKLRVRVKSPFTFEAIESIYLN